MARHKVGAWFCVQATGAALFSATLAYAPQSKAQFQDGMNIAVGTKVESVADYIDPAGHLHLKRNYTSALIAANPTPSFGPHWRHAYDVSLPTTSSTSKRANRPSGNSYGFSGSGGTWTPAPDVRERLARLLSGTTVIGWRLTTPDDVAEVYDVNGKLQRIEYLDGDVLTILRDTSGRVSAVTDRKGRSLTFVYEIDRLDHVVLPDGRRIEYGYDAAQLLTSVSYQVTDNEPAEFVSVQYLYQENSGRQLLTGVIDEGQQRLAAWTYDGSGRVTSSRKGSADGSIHLTQVAYGVGQSWVTGPLGETVTSTYSSIHRRPKVTGSTKPCLMCGGGSASSRTYDANGYPDVVADFNGTTTDYGYNARGLIESETQAANKPEATRTVQTTWHSTFRVPVERRTYDSAGALAAKSTWTYNARGQVLVASRIDPVSGLTRATTTTYCEQADVTSAACPLVGLVKQVDGPRTDVVDVLSYQYYAADHPGCATSQAACTWRKGDLWKVTNALGQVTETLRYDGAGRVLSVKDANSIITDIEYHPRGWLTARKVRGADDSSEADDQITRIDYYPTGVVSSTTLPDGSFTSYVYDAAHRLTDVVDADGNSIHYTLDNAGNRTKEAVKGSDGSLKRTLSRVYNQLGQLQTAKDAGNHPTGFTYDTNGNVDTTTDALGRVADNDYDSLNRLSRTLQDVSGIAASTGFKYDAQDNLTEVVDPKGLSTKYQYNAFGDLTRLESPDTGVTTYGYDAGGNRTSALDARGEPSSYTYDALNRLTGIAYSDAALNVTYTYDAVQPVCDAGESFATGRLTRMDDGSGNTQYCHDRFGNLTRKVQVTNGQSFTLRYAYTKAGQLAAMQYPDGMTVDYVRDGLGRATEVGVTLSGGTRQVLLTGATYHPFGPVAGWTFGNGRTMSRTLDLDYRPRTILSTGTGTGGLNLGFGWDAVGNMASLHTSGLEQPPRVTFGYDALNRLTAFQDGPTGAAIEQYTYDATGNRTSFKNAGGTQPYTYPSDSHRITAVNGVVRTYDALGNTVSIGGTQREFAYNAAGRMSQVRRDNVLGIEYAYNGRGEQVRKHLAASNTYALYEESGGWQGEYSNEGTPTQQVVWLDSLPVGLISNGQIYYAEADHLGTPRAVIEPQRDVGVWTWDIANEAFGNSAPNQDPDTDDTEFVFNMRFPGQRYDAASGLNYNYFRDYDAGSGRYAESDPIGLYGGINTFSYAEGDPLGLIDPAGLSGSRPGGPYHPPLNVKTKCRPTDTCGSASGKAWVLWRMITSHQGWDWRNAPPRGGGRHHTEIRDLWIQFGECLAIAARKCAEECKNFKPPRMPVLPVIVVPPGFECGPGGVECRSDPGSA